MVIAGVGHVQGRFGVPDRGIEARTGCAPFVIVPGRPNRSDDTGGCLGLIYLCLSADGDWAWYTEQELML